MIQAHYNKSLGSFPIQKNSVECYKRVFFSKNITFQILKGLKELLMLIKIWSIKGGK